MPETSISIERFKSQQMRAGRRACLVCLGLAISLIATGWKGGLVFGMPLPVVFPLSFAFGLAGLMAYLFVDSLRHGLIFTRFGIVDRRRSPRSFSGYLALMGALSLLAGGAAIVLVIYSRANPDVV